METAFVLLRAVHIGALVALLGGLVFEVWIAGPCRQPLVDRELEPQRRLIRLSAGWLALAIVSGVFWLAFEAIAMSGLPPEQALGRQTLGVVLMQTHFGRIWMARAVLCLSLAALLFAASRPDATHRTVLFLACTAVAAALLSALAGVGHANAEHGLQRLLHLAADAIHLLAAGSWLGALLPLAGMFARQRRAAGPGRLDELAQVTQRFSALGLICVAALIVSGAVNAWFTVATFSGLTAKHYGHLLLVKLALFGAMLGLATVNRTRLTPLLANLAVEPRLRATALRRLQRNATTEAALGLLILGIVGALGMTMPAAHSTMMTPSMHLH
ncbi:MAG: copper homeostasis membrane protein CopD [Caldimonas sp.]